MQVFDAAPFRYVRMSKVQGDEDVSDDLKPFDTECVERFPVRSGQCNQHRYE